MQNIVISSSALVVAARSMGGQGPSGLMYRRCTSTARALQRWCRDGAVRPHMQQLGVGFRKATATRLTCWTPQGPLIIDACRPHLEVVCKGHGVHAPRHHLQHLQQRSRG